MAAVRSLLPATGAGIYLNAGAAGPMSTETQRAIDEQAQRELTTGRGHPDLAIETLERVNEARAAVAAVLVADPDAITINHGASTACAPGSAAIGMAVGRPAPHDGARGGRARPPARRTPRRRKGVEVDIVDVEWQRRTAVWAMTPSWRRSASTRTPGARRRGEPRPADHGMPSCRSGGSASLALGAGASVLVDGAQAAGAIPVSVEDLGVDAYVVPAWTWLLGPEGMGAVWTGGSRTGAASPELHRPSIVGFARTCGWLSMYVGLPWAQERATRLAAGALDRLARIPGVTVLTPRERMATLVAFRISGWTAAAARDELQARVFAILADVPALDALRISVGFWATEEELERFADAVELLARHTPSTLPPRRTLTILGSDDRPLR